MHNTSPISAENVNFHNNPNFNKVVTNLKKELKVTEEKAIIIATEVFKLQETLPAGRTVSYTPSETLPFVLTISREYIGWQQKKVGSGGEFSVFKTKVFPTTRFSLLGDVMSPSKPFTAATKTAHKSSTSLTPKRKTIDELFKEDKKFAEIVDRFLMTYRDENEKAVSLHHYHPSDLYHYSFSKGNTLPNVLNVFISVSFVLEFINRNQFIHRDIKPGNILIGEQCKGIISDFGLLLPLPTKMHTTCGTPHYMDPYMFGDEKNNLVNQIKRQGQQTLEGEVFALGRTLSETLLKLLKELSQDIEKKEGLRLGDLTDKIDLKRYNYDISEMTPEMIFAKLKEISLKHPFLANCNTIKDSKTNKLILDLYLFPPLLDRRADYIKACSMLEDLLDRKEIDALICLTILACNMQVEPKIRPTMEQIHHQFQTIRTTFDENGDFHALKDSLTQNPQGIQKRAKVDLTEAFELSLQQSTLLESDEINPLEKKDGCEGK